MPLNLTRENIIIREYLLRRIFGMLNEKNKLTSDFIRYDSLYEQLQLEAPTEATLRARKRNIRNKVKTLLEAWTNTELIQGFEEIKEGTTIKGVRIYLVRRLK